METAHLSDPFRLGIDRDRMRAEPAPDIDSRPILRIVFHHLLYQCKADRYNTQFPGQDGADSAYLFRSDQMYRERKFSIYRTDSYS